MIVINPINTKPIPKTFLSSTYKPIPNIPHRKSDSNFKKIINKISITTSTNEPMANIANILRHPPKHPHTLFTAN